MTRLFHFMLGLWLAASSYAAAPDAGVKLAVILEAPKAALPADLLTAEFSRLRNVQVLERAEVDRIYREQGFSALNRDELKLGRLLGADGLLLLDYENEETVLPKGAPFAAPSSKTLNESPAGFFPRQPQ